MSIRDVWDTIKYVNVYIMGVPVEEARKDRKNTWKNKDWKHAQFKEKTLVYISKMLKELQVG